MQNEAMVMPEPEVSFLSLDEVLENLDDLEELRLAGFQRIDEDAMAALESAPLVRVLIEKLQKWGGDIKSLPDAAGLMENIKVFHGATKNIISTMRFSDESVELR